MEGEMNHGMEDYVFAQHRKLNGYDLGLYAIFDGPQVAMLQNICKAIYLKIYLVRYIF
jgi:hypothetical protein